MAKVDLDKVRLGVSPISGNVYAGTIKGDGARRQWINRVDVSGDFIHAVITKWENQSEIIEDEDQNKWEITVRKL